MPGCKASMLAGLFVLSGCLVTTDEDAWKDGAVQPDTDRIDQQTGDGPGREAAVDGPPDGSKPDGPRPDGPKPDGPKPDGPKPDGPRPDGPKPDGPKPDGPKPDGPKPDLVPVDLPPNAEGNLPLGSACLVDAQCQSGHCRDGHCCGSACAGPCVACNLAGKEGTCSVVPAGTDPDGDCKQDPVGTCGLDGTCDGAGGCRFYPVGTVCATNCTSTSASTVSTCDTSATCVPGTQTDCLPFACNSATGDCFTVCATDAQCVSYRCNTATSQCYTKCTTVAECQPGSKCNPQGKCV